MRLTNNQDQASEFMHSPSSVNTHENIVTHAYNYQFPGLYHPDRLVQMYTITQEPLPFTNVTENLTENDLSMSPQRSKRRRLSIDSASASEPPSAVSFAPSPISEVVLPGIADRLLSYLLCRYGWSCSPGLGNTLWSRQHSSTPMILLPALPASASQRSAVCSCVER